MFVGTWDSKLTALSAATGKVLWEVSVGEYPGTYISGAPLVYGDLVVTGSGEPAGIRARVYRRLRCEHRERALAL